MAKPPKSKEKTVSGDSKNPNSTYRVPASSKPTQSTGNGGGGSGSSQPKASTPTGSTGGNFDTAGGKIGYADASVTQIKTGAAEAQGGTVLYSTTYKGGSGKKTNAGGQTINVQQTPTPAAAQQAREAILKTKNPNELTTSQQADLQAAQQREADKRQRQNQRAETLKTVQELEKEGYKFQSLEKVNGKLVLKAAQGNTEIKENEFRPSPVVETTPFYAPRTRSPQETTEVKTPVTFNSPFPKTNKYGANINADTPRTDTRTKLQKAESLLNVKQAEFTLEATKPGNELQQLILIPETFTYGIITESVNIGKGIFQVYKNTPDPVNEPVQFLTYPVEIGSGIIEGTSEQISRTATAAQKGDFLALSTEAGSLTAQAGFGEGLGRVAKIPSKLKAKVDEINYNIKYGNVEYDLARARALNTDYGYKFEPQKEFNLIPPEFTELGNQVKTNNPKEILTGIENTPSFYLEIGQALAKNEQLNPSKVPELQTQLINERPFPVKAETPNINVALEQIRTGNTVQRELLDFTTNVKSVNLPGGGKGVILENGELLQIEPSTSTKRGFRLFDNKKGQSQGSILITVEKEANKIIDQYKNKYATYRNSPSTYPVNEIGNPSKTKIVLPLNVDFRATPSQADKITNFQGLRTPAKTIPGNKLALEINTGNALATSSFSKARSTTRTETAQGQAQSQSQAQSQIQALEISSVQAQSITTKTKTRTETRTETPTSKNPNPFKPKKETKQTKNKPSTFLAEVRTRGKFETIAKTSSIGGAFQAALKKTRNTASASLRVREESTGETIDLNSLPSDFSKSQREQGVYIQKRSKRISTGGEKGEITLKGIFSNKNKQRGKTKWGF